MIPKIIHYCWFGGKPKPKDVIRFIDTWKKCLPDYFIKEWNESNYDIQGACNYVKEAYKKGKFAFVSDYVRIYALYTEGGIYLDTDVEVINSYSALLSYHAFIGLETTNQVATCVIAGERHFPLFKHILNYYHRRNFIDSNGHLDITPNPVIITKIIKDQYGDIEGNTYLNKEIFIAPQDYFSPKSFETGLVNITNNTISIHHFQATWMPKYFVLEKNFWNFFGLKNLKLILRLIYLFKYGTIRSTPPNIRKEKHL